MPIRRVLRHPAAVAPSGRVPPSSKSGTVSDAYAYSRAVAVAVAYAVAVTVTRAISQPFPFALAHATAERMSRRMRRRRGLYVLDGSRITLSGPGEPAERQVAGQAV